MLSVFFSSERSLFHNSNLFGSCIFHILYTDPAEIKSAQCCIKLVFHLIYIMMEGSTKLKYIKNIYLLFISSLINCLITH